MRREESGMTSFCTALASVTLFVVAVTASDVRPRFNVSTRTRTGEAFSHVLGPSQFGLPVSGAVQYSFIQALPAWLKVTPPETESLDVTSVQVPILYGTPHNEDIGTEFLMVYAVHLDTMRSASLTIEINVQPFEPFTTEVILLVCNMNLREFITENQPVALTAKLQALWSDTNSHAVITKLESFADKGRPIPIPPGQEGMFVTASISESEDFDPCRDAQMTSCGDSCKYPTNVSCSLLDLDSNETYRINWCQLQLEPSAPSVSPTVALHSDPKNVTSGYIAVLRPLEDDYDKSTEFYWTVVLGCCIAVVVAAFLGYVMFCRRHTRPYKVSDESTDKAGKAIRKATVALRKMNIQPVAMQVDWDELLIEPDKDKRPKRATSSDVEDKKGVPDTDSDESESASAYRLGLDRKIDVFESSGDDTTLRKKKVPDYRYPPSYQAPRSSQSPPQSQPAESSRQPPNYVSPPSDQAHTADNQTVDSSRDPPTYKKPPQYGDSQSSLRSGATDENVGPAPQYQRPPQH